MITAYCKGEKKIFFFHFDLQNHLSFTTNLDRLCYVFTLVQFFFNLFLKNEKTTV